MKSLLVAALLLVAGIGYCADQPHNIGYASTGGPFGLYSRTLEQMNLLAPYAAGQMIYVSDAAQSRVCVASGTAAGAWVVAVATGVFTAASYPHCN